VDSGSLPDPELVIWRALSLVATIGPREKNFSGFQKKIALFEKEFSHLWKPRVRSLK
jgi:hypothetical protein